MNQTCSPPAAPGDQEVTLLDQVRWVTNGYPVADVAVVAQLLLTECCMQNTPDKATALAILDGAHQNMRRQIEGNYWQHRLNSLFFRWVRQ